MLTLGAVLLAVLVLPSPWGWSVVLVAAAVDVVETVIMVRWSKRRRAVVGREAFVGRTAVVSVRLAPAGSVRLDGELWAARTDSTPIERGETVAVGGVEGLVLLVDRPSADPP